MAAVGLRLLLPFFPAVGGDFGVDLLHRELIETDPFGVIANLREGRIFGGYGFGVIGNAHRHQTAGSPLRAMGKAPLIVRQL